MKQQLEIDDLREGMFVTILQGKMYPGRNEEDTEDCDHRRDKGKILEIYAIDIPYIAVEVHDF